MITEIERLQSNELFEALTEDELSTLSPLCSEFVAAEDATIFAEGRNSSRVYVITEGQIALQRAIRVPHATRSRRTTVALCRTGDVVGWSALVEPYRYTLSAVAWDSSRLISIDAKMLRKALDMYPEMGFKVMKSLSGVMGRRLAQTTEALINAQQVSLSGLKT